MQQETTSDRAVTRRTRLALASYLVLFVAGFTAVAPVLQVIAPLHVERIDGEAKTRILSVAMFWGALAAAAGNVAMGAVSDRTRSRFGRRRPWIAVGAILTVISYFVIARSTTPVGFIMGLVAFQLAFNVMMAPLVAVFAESTPLNARSTVSALMGLGYPMAVALGSALMALGPQHETGRLALLAGVLLCAAFVFLLVFDEASAPPQPLVSATAQPRRWTAMFSPFRCRNFSFVWAGRLLIATGYALVSVYLLYFISDAVRWPGHTPERAHAFLTGSGFIAVVLVAVGIAVIGGRVRRRRPIGLAGAIILCVATVALALAPSWSVAVAAFIVYGLGQGAYGSVEMGLMADALPRDDNRGRDMGLNNLAVTLPQAFAPVAALALEGAGLDVRSLFLAAALCFAAAAVVMASFRLNAGGKAAIVA